MKDITNDLLTWSVWVITVIFFVVVVVIVIELYNSYHIESKKEVIGASQDNANLELKTQKTSDQEVIVVGIFPRFSVAQTAKAYQPLITRLSQALGKPVELVIPVDFPTFWREIQNGEYSLAHYNQYHYLKTHKDYGYEQIVCNEEFGRRTISGAIFVRKDSGIEKVSDLRGRKIIFGGDRTAMVSYIAPVGILKAHGLMLGVDYEVAFAKNPPAAVINMGKRIFDAAGSGDVIISSSAVTSELDVSEIKMLARSDEFVQLVWAASPKIGINERNTIQKTMTTLKDSDSGKEILKEAKVTDFYPVTDIDFNKARQMVQFAIGEVL